MTITTDSDCGYRGSRTYSYNRGCRCETCIQAMRQARNASAKRTGLNIRQGRRAEVKRAWDRNNKR